MPNIFLTIKVTCALNGYDQSIPNVFLTIKDTCIFNRVLNVFLTITVNLLYRVFSSSDLKHITSFWFNGLFMDDLPCLLVVRKKYTNSYGKDSKYTNAVDISITGSCGRERCRRCRVILRWRGRRRRVMSREKVGSWLSFSISFFSLFMYVSCDFFASFLSFRIFCNFP